MVCIPLRLTVQWSSPHGSGKKNSRPSGQLNKGFITLCKCALFLLNAENPSVKIFDFDSSPFKGASAMWHLWCYCNAIASDSTESTKLYPLR